jgi:hypothetical protein
VNYIFNQSIEKEFASFKSGFNAVCGNATISLFRPEELELLVCGTNDLDFSELELVTVYEGFSRSSMIIRSLWELLISVFTIEQKKKFLFFATGSDRAPVGGLGQLNFSISRSGPDSDRLPSSHTCFNVLLLPDYIDSKKLHEKLLTAIENSEGFGMI